MQSIAPSSPFCLNELDHRPAFRKITDLIVSLFRQVQASYTVLYHRLFHPIYHLCNQKVVWKEHSKALFVFVHGLNGDPASFYHQIQLLKQEEEVDIFIPRVPDRGACPLKEAATPILTTVLDFAKAHPKKPICLLGVSNGARITSQIEVSLRKEAPTTPVMVSNIAGAHLGTTRVQQLERWKLLKWFYKNPSIQELKYNSFTAKNLLESIKAPLPKECAERRFDYFASIDDLVIPDLESTLPTIDKNERRFALFGQSHDSIINHVARVQIAAALSWQRLLKET